MHELIEARDEKRLLRLQRQLASHKLLIVDELGYVPLSQIGAELLFEVLSQRYERGATIVTSNLPFDEWTSMFGSERLTCLMTLPLAPALVAGAFLCAQWIETSRSFGSAAAYSIPTTGSEIRMAAIQSGPFVLQILLFAAAICIFMWLR